MMLHKIMKNRKNRRFVQAGGYKKLEWVIIDCISSPISIAGVGNSEHNMRHLKKEKMGTGRGEHGAVDRCFK